MARRRRVCSFHHKSLRQQPDPEDGNAKLPAHPAAEAHQIIHRQCKVTFAAGLCFPEGYGHTVDAEHRRHTHIVSRFNVVSNVAHHGHQRNARALCPPRHADDHLAQQRLGIQLPFPGEHHICPLQQLVKAHGHCLDDLQFWLPIQEFPDVHHSNQQKHRLQQYQQQCMLKNYLNLLYKEHHHYIQYANP